MSEHFHYKPDFLKWSHNQKWKRVRPGECGDHGLLKDYLIVCSLMTYCSKKFFHGPIDMLRYNFN